VSVNRSLVILALVSASVVAAAGFFFLRQVEPDQPVIPPPQVEPESEPEQPEFVLGEIWERAADSRASAARPELVPVEPEPEQPGSVLGEIWERATGNRVSTGRPDLVPVESDTSTPTGETQDRTVATQSAFVIVALLLSLCVNVMLVLWLAKWRRLTSTDLQIIPSDLISTIEKHNTSFQQLTSTVAKGSERYLASSAELLQAFKSLQTALDEKDAEIKRLKQGYDTELFRRFLRRFIRLDKAFCEDISDLPPLDEKERKTLEHLRALLRDALDECGVIEFQPEVGASVRGIFGVDDSYEVRSPERPDQELTIAEVLEPGLKIDAPNGPICLKEARVVVFSTSRRVD